MSLLELGGRTFAVPVGEVTLGSDAACAIPLTGAGVLPRHAVFQGQPDGQVVIRKATPAAEVMINGVRLGSEPTPLLHGGKVEGGDHKLTFVDEGRSRSTRHVQALPRGPARAHPATAEPPVPANTGGRLVSLPHGRGDAPQPPPGESERLRDTMHGFEPAPRPSQARSLASFLVKSGALKGQRLQVKTPVVNVGRADYNDLVISDGSVSTAHAKLQRREGVWVLVDLDSTNGTFVDGERVHGESPLAPGAVVRFGDVQLVFEPTDDALAVAKGGGTQVLRTPHSVPPAPPKPAPPKPPPAAKAAAPAAAPPAGRPVGKPGGKRPQTAPPPEKKGKGCGAGAVILLLGGAGGAGLIPSLPGQHAAGA